MRGFRLKMLLYIAIIGLFIVTYLISPDSTKIDSEATNILVRAVEDARESRYIKVLAADKIGHTDVKQEQVECISEEDTEDTEDTEKFIPETLKKMMEYDYVGESITGLSTELQSLKDLQKGVDKYGKLCFEGMPLEEYKSTMEYIWEDCTDYNNAPIEINVDIKDTINHGIYVHILKRLSRYDGVYLYKIGEATSGNLNIYAIEIDINSDYTKKTIMLTGQTHAREFAGGTYCIKMLVDLVQKAQTDEEVLDMLKKYKFVAVPIINVDMRNAIIADQDKWTTKSGELWKAYENGTDGNRNYPGLAWGQLSHGCKLKWNIKSKPTFAGYMGDYAGSNSETKALMKWIYHYVVIDKAECLIDLHQQGRVVYAGKGWSTKEQEKNATRLRNDILQLLNKGNNYCYRRIDGAPKYGLDGAGSTLTDYACALAFGAKFSPAYGYHVMTDGKKEYNLIEFQDIDKLKFKPVVPNNGFVTLTLEIGYGKGYLGNSASTRKRLSKEYEDCNFDILLEALPSMLDR